MDITETIVAIASPPGPSLRGILRVSGPGTAECLAPILDEETAGSISRVKHRGIHSCRIQLDEETSLGGDLLFWPDERSYTRQPTAEFHTVGSPELLKLVLAAICKQGARLAGPGEFTLRAFLSGRIDLTQAEAVLAVIDSSSQSQLDVSLQQLAGGLAGPLSEIRDSLLYLLAELEAGLDFVEEDIEFISSAEIQKRLNQSSDRLHALMQQIGSRDTTATTFNVTFVGQPNAGKSSLFNVLTGDQSAIVTDQAGTTRDYLTASLLLPGGLPVQLIDTAGIENTTAANDSATIAGAAQALTEQQTSQSDLRLLCIPCDQKLTPWLCEQIALADSRHTIVVLTKSDLADQSSERLGEVRGIGFTGQIVTTSSVELKGIAALKHSIASLIVESQNTETPIAATTIVRVRSSLNDAHDLVKMATQAAKSEIGQELIAAEVRTALDALGQVVGTVYTDDILDVVFGRFCIGK